MTEQTPPTQAHADTTARLRAAFAANPIDDSAIKTAVCAFVDEMKEANWPVERVIIQIKRIAEAQQETWHLPGRSMARRLSELQRAVSRAVTWCIEHYFWTDRPRT